MKLFTQGTSSQLYNMSHELAGLLLSNYKTNTKCTQSYHYR